MMRKTIKVLMAVLCVSLSLGVITACKKTEEPKKTKLDSPVISSKEYTGSNQTATVAENEAYEVTVNEGGINVGEYDVVLTLTDTKKYEWANPDADDKTKVTLKFTITKATNEITVLTLADWTYDEQANEPTATAKFGTPEFTYATSENGEYTATVPSAVGKYWVKATVEGTSNYDGAIKTAQFEIKKAASAVTTAPAAKTELVYNRNAQELVTAGAANGGTLNYKLGENGTWSETIPTATDAGDYKVYYKVVGDGSHSDTAETEISVTIAQATNEITGISIAGWTYGETANEPTATAKFGTATFTYATSENGTYSETVPIDAGDYWVKATVAETKNYAGATQTLKFTIAKADSTVKTAAAEKELTYNGAAQELVNAATTDDGTIEYKLGKDGAWSANIPTASNAGSYKVYYRIVGDSNHNGFENEILSVNVTISKLKIAKPVADTTVFTYSGNEQTYNVAANDRYTVSNDKQTNAGNYKVAVALKDKANVSWADDTTADLSFDFNIGKKSVEVVWTKADSYVYNDTALIAPTAVMTNVKGEEVALTVSGETLDKAGTFTFTATTEDTNYELTNATCSVTVVLYNEITEFTVTAELNCDETPDINATAKHGEAKYFYAEAEDGEYKEITSETVFAPEKLYYVKAVVAAGENYIGATSEIKTFIKNHEYNENGKCVKGDAYNTAGVTYAYGADKGEYYVTGCADSVTELVILPAYNDGEHGEKAVTYVAHRAFADKTNIVKVILPESVTDLGGSSFAGCSNLVYVYMPGVKSLIYAVDGRPDGKKDCNNNFLQCYKLTTVIIASDFYTNTQQFTNGNGDISRIDGAVLEFYVNASAGAPNLEGNNNLWTGNVFYKGDATKCMQWNFDENGNVIHGASEHDFENVKCKVCGKYSDELTQGVVYEYDREEGCYYVGSNRTLNVSELTILDKYNDGIHGENGVTYVRNCAFMENPYITKVILPESVTLLDGAAFMNCANLEYVSMTGIVNMPFVGGQSRYYVQNYDTTNNFTFCAKLKYVIVNKNFNLYYTTTDARQFHGRENGTADIFVDGSKAESSVNCARSDGNNLLTGNIYYKGDASKCLQWNFGSDGITIEHGETAHHFVNGICACGEKDAMGVEYKFYNGTYYVSKYTGTAETVNVFGEWNDGENGNANVTFVKNGAFSGNPYIKKVIFHENIATLDGEVFSGCSNLEFVSMKGVANLALLNLSNQKIYTGECYSSNNFMNCGKLKVVIVGKNFNCDPQMFKIWGNDNITACTDIYVEGSEEESHIVLSNDQNALLTKTVYYYSETAKSGCWHYDEQGNVALWA